MRYQAWTDSVVLVSPTSHKEAQMFFVPFLRLINEMVADGVVSEFGVGLHIHFVEDAAAIRADGFVAE